MMPLLLADVGEENIIRKVGGSPEMKKHLEDLGFVVGGTVRVVSEINGNLIVIAAKSFDLKDNLLSCGLPIIAEILWMVFQIKNLGNATLFGICIIILLLFALVLSLFAGGWKYEKAH